MESLIPSAFRRFRNRKGWKLVDVSAETNMSIQHLSEIESGKRDPRLSSIERVAAALGLNLILVPEELAPDVRRFLAQALPHPPSDHSVNMEKQK